MALIIDPTTGTVLDLEDCYIVFDETFTHEEEAMMNSGSKSEIEKLALREGVPLAGDALEWVKYGRLTSVSYGPMALRDEAGVLLDTLPESDNPEDANLRGLLKWVLDGATDAQLAWLGQTILNDDAVWNGYRDNFVYGLKLYAEGHEPF